MEDERRTERHVTSVSLDLELYERLRIRAFNEHTSQSRIIAYALLEYFDRLEGADAVPVP